MKTEGDRDRGDERAIMLSAKNQNACKPNEFRVLLLSRRGAFTKIMYFKYVLVKISYKLLDFI